MVARASAIEVVSLVAPASDERVQIASPRPVQRIDVDMHRRSGMGIAGCGIPAKQDQLTDDGGYVTCRRRGCR